MHIESKEQKELIHIKEEKNKLEKVKVENEIIKKDISNIDFEQKEHICPRRLEILKRFKSKLTSYLNVRRKCIFSLHILAFFHFSPYILILPLLVPKLINAFHFGPLR